MSESVTYDEAKAFVDKKLPRNKEPRVLAEREKPQKGWSTWTENGVRYTAPTVRKDRFGGHAYDDGGYDQGINNCACGCSMYSFSSSGPVDPFGPCPKNPLPKKKHGNRKSKAKKATRRNRSRRKSVRIYEDEPEAVATVEARRLGNAAR